MLVGFFEYSSRILKWATEIGRDYTNKMIMSPRIAYSWKDFVFYLVLNFTPSEFCVSEFVEKLRMIPSILAHGRNGIWLSGSVCLTFHPHHKDNSNDNSEIQMVSECPSVDTSF